MTIAVGVAKQVKFKKESSWGVVPAASGAQLLRRVTSGLNLVKETYESEEIRPDYQISDFRHGIRKVEGDIVDEISPGTHGDFYAAALRSQVNGIYAVTGLSLTIAGAGPTYTITRATGSFITDEVKVGDVIRLTGSFDSANLLNNILVIGETATVLTVVTLNGSALVAEGPVASASVVYQGDLYYTPTSSHTDTSFSFEQWYSDVSQSEVYSGLKVAKIDVDLPATGMAKITLTFMGKDIIKSTSEYFTAPTAATTSSVLAAVNGLVYVDGSPITLITSMKFTIDGNMTSEAVVGSNTVPDIFEGTVKVTGEFTAFFEDDTFLDYFDNESEVSLYCAFTGSNANNASFIGYNFPRVKVGGATKDDGQKGIVQTIPFQALFNAAGGTGTNSYQSTLIIQDKV